MEELLTLRKEDPDKMIRAPLVQINTSMATNGWWYGYAWASCRHEPWLVSRTRKDPKIQKILNKHEKIPQPSHRLGAARPEP